MLCFPNAKINIGLYILERRSDHFHNIETLFYPVPLSDILEIIVLPQGTDSGVDLRLTGLPIDGQREDNLCMKAYQLLSSRFQIPPIKIILHKIIPMGAGLGGGSSNGAQTIILLNKMFRLKLDPDELRSYASQLGSDCSFFIDNRAAIGLEKGNKLLHTNVNLSGCYLIIVKPDVAISTSEAYAGIQPSRTRKPLHEMVKLPISDWKENILNDFEKTIFNKFPEIKDVKEKLYRFGALYASMTGSGSAVYGIFENEKWLKESFKDMFYWGGWL